MTTHINFHPPTQPVTPDSATHLNPIFNKLSKHFKKNLSHHLVLQHCENIEPRFLHASVNNAYVLDRPDLISNNIYFGTFLKDKAQADPLAYILHSSPDTKWLVEELPATSHYFYLFHLKDALVGFMTDENITASIKNNQNTLISQNNITTHKPYDDKKCIFRCLALHWRRL